jgi:hypothetical protein
MNKTKYIIVVMILLAGITLVFGECRLLMQIARNAEDALHTPPNAGFSIPYGRAFYALEEQSINNGNDGWGIVYYEKDAIVTGEGTIWAADSTYTSNRFASYHPAHQDNNYLNTWRYEIGGEEYDLKLVAAHVREATSGSPDIPNPHPFVFNISDGNHEYAYVFAHNGSADSYVVGNMSTFIQDLVNQYSWNDEIWSEWYSHEVDSGVYFGFIMAHIKLNNWDILRGMKEALSHPYIIGSGWTGRNFIFSDGYDAYAYRSYDQPADQWHYNLEYAIIDSLWGFEDLPEQAVIMSEFPNWYAFNDNKVELDQNELVYIPRRGEPVHFKYFSLNTIRYVKNPKPPYEGAQDYWTWDSFPVLDPDPGVTAIDVMTQDYPSGSGVGFDEAYYVRDQEGDNIQRRSATDPWLQNGLTSFDDVSGYKIRHFEYNDNAIAHIAGEIAPHHSYYTLQPGEENWVGYWLLNSQSLKQALGIHFDKVLSVEARDWYYKDKTDPRSGDGSTIPSSCPNKPMEFGQMYIIMLKPEITQPVNLNWTNSRRPMSLQLPSSPEYFTYEHGDEYEVVDVDMNARTDDILEIGVFAGETCIGAAQVDEFPVQVLYYPEGYEGMPLEFQFYYGDRNVSALQNNMLVYDERTGSYNPGRLIAGEVKYHRVMLQERQTESLQVDNEHNVSFAPNPFNPDVSISLNLQHQSEVEIAIYNTKGQLVKNIANGEYPAGTYHFNWNGRNAKDRIVSSGIYLCRIKTGQTSSNHKLILLK